MKVYSNSSRSPLKNNNNQEQKTSVIVQINIGRNGKTKTIQIENINNLQKVSAQIKQFILKNNLKAEAYTYIRSIINTKIKEKNPETSNKNHTVCNSTCKCKNVMKRFEQREKRLSDIICNISPAKGSEKKQPHYSKIDLKQKKQNQEKIIIQQQNSFSSGIFNMTFTQPSSRGEKNFAADDMFEDVLQNFEFKQLSQLKNQKENTRKNKIIEIKKSPNKIPISFNSRKDSFLNTPTGLNDRKNKENLEEKQNLRVSLSPNNTSRRISTKQRKQSIMTPRKLREKNTFKTQPDIQVIDAKNLQQMVRYQQNKLRSEIHSKTSKKQSFPVQEKNQSVIDRKLSKLFKKLTSENPDGYRQLSSQYVSYQNLDKQELIFMGALLEKMNYKQMNHLTEQAFKNNAIKYCKDELQDLCEKEKFIKPKFNKESIRPSQFFVY